MLTSAYSGVSQICNVRFSVCAERNLFLKVSTIIIFKKGINDHVSVDFLLLKACLLGVLTSMRLGMGVWHHN